LLPPKIPAEAIRQLAGHNGLAQVRVHAGGHAVITVFAHHIGGERNDGHSLAEAILALQFTDAGGGGESVHDGHLAIHQHDIERTLREALQSLGPVVRDRDLAGQFLQQPVRDALIHRIVLDQEDAVSAKGGLGARRGGRAHQAG
jgi:hypothetical protein